MDFSFKQLWVYLDSLEPHMGVELFVFKQAVKISFVKVLVGFKQQV